MTRLRRMPPPLLDIETERFATAEEAWFWSMRSQQARDDGARQERGLALFVRPCDPDDVYRAIKGLVKARAIGPRHVMVLKTYGELYRAPDKRCEEEAVPFALWDEALDRLTTVLRTKEIIE